MNAKATVYAYVAQIAKALSSPKRLELLELLAQGEKSVETLVRQTGLDLRLASAHLRALREARVVKTRREGKFIYYRLSGHDVATLCVALRATAEEHLVELRLALEQMSSAETLSPESRASLLAKARTGDVVVIDVRPAAEYEAGHLPFARSLPLSELKKRLDELPHDKSIVAYCRGPYCVMSDEAVTVLRKQGFSAYKIKDGVSEWRAGGYPVTTSATT